MNSIDPVDTIDKMNLDPSAEGSLLAYLRHLRLERGLAEQSTLKSYGYQIRTYLAFLRRRGRDATSASRDDVLTFLEKKRAEGQRTSSLFSAAIAVRQYHRFLAAEGITASDPTAGMRLPKFEQRLPDPLSEEEMRRLLDRPCGGRFVQIRNAAMLEFLYGTCIRVSELTGLMAEQVDLKGGFVRVFGKGAKERIVPVGPRATAILLRYLEAKASRFQDRGGTLFVSNRGRPLTRGSVWLALKRTASTARVRGRVFPHRIRHSGATALLAGGADIRFVQEMLGHASITTTQIYTHVSPELLKKAVAKSHPRY